jgi:cysteine desulfurase
VTTQRHPALAGGPIYLDYNATTPVDPRVVDAMLPYLTRHFGNPSSTHAYAAAPAQALRVARRQVAALIGATPDTIVFTGSGSEANNLAIRGAVLGAGQAHVVTQQTEHPAVLATCRALQRVHGLEVTYLAVDRHGLVDPADLAAAITPRTRLVSIMYANNETGTIQPIADLARVAHEHGALFAADVTLTTAVVETPLDAWGVDAATRDRLLGIIEQRCLLGTNGAEWFVRRMRQRTDMERFDALRATLLEYRERMHSNEPVHTWD